MDNEIKHYEVIKLNAALNPACDDYEIVVGIAYSQPAAASAALDYSRDNNCICSVRAVPCTAMNLEQLGAYAAWKKIRGEATVSKSSVYWDALDAERWGKISLATMDAICIHREIISNKAVRV